jgi:hypothetical protein
MTVPCLARKLHSPCTLPLQNPGNLYAHSTHKLKKQRVHGLLIRRRVITKINRADLHSILTALITDVVHFGFLKDYTWITPLVKTNVTNVTTQEMK